MKLARPTIAIGVVLTAALPSVLRAQKVNFDGFAAGVAPSGWTIAMTHAGGSPRWEILKDSSAPSSPNVFAQTSMDRTAGRFPLAVWNERMLKDGTISVKFKAVSGSVDQGAGLVWRYRDANNYYIVRANALEDNVVLYKVENGERLALAPIGSSSKTYGVKHKVPKQQWGSLSVSFRGNLFEVRFDGDRLFEVADSTFSGPGKVGLWTKADSVIYFDDFEVAENTAK